MPKAKATGPNSTKATAQQPTHIAQVMKYDELAQILTLHNKGHKETGSINPEPIYGVVVFKAENFTEHYSVMARSFLIGSNNPCFAFVQNPPVACYGDCLDKSQDQGVRLDWLTWKVESCYMWENREEAKLLDSYFMESAKEEEVAKAREEAAKAEAKARAEADKAAEKAAKEKSKAEAEAAKAAKTEPAPAPAETKAEKKAKKIPRGVCPQNLEALIREQHAKRIMALPRGEEYVAVARGVIESFCRAMNENGKGKIEDADVAEAVLLIEANVKKLAEKQNAQPKADPKAEPTAEKPESEKAKSKGPSKTSKPAAKPAQGKAPSFPVPVKRGKK